MLLNILVISVSVSVIITILLILSPIINNRYQAFWRYLIWGILAVRLIIPFRPEFDFAPVKINIPNSTVSQEAFVSAHENTPNISENEHTESTADSRITETSNKTTPITEKIQIAKITPYTIMTSLWALGAALFFLLHIVGYIIFRVRIKESLIEEEKGVYRSNMVKGAVMTGFVNPIIILPDTDYTPDERDAVIKHEKMHQKRRDIWYKFLMLTANAMHWFNPLVYIMVKNANLDMEYSCDDMVVKNMNMEFRKTI